MKLGVLIIGSLWWRQGARENWRTSRLNSADRMVVKVPIRYGRKSRNNTYTTTIHPDAKAGIAMVVPCLAEGDIGALRVEAQKLWEAEAGESAKPGSLAASWGSVGALFRQGTETAQVEAWSEFFRTNGGEARAAVNQAGLLNIPWPMRIDGGILDCDVLLATSTREQELTNPEGIAAAWIANQDGVEAYFFENVKHGIRTADDGAIWRRMQHRPDWFRDKEILYPEAFAILRQESPPIKLPRVRYFAPEVWGAVEKFAHFYSSTYQFPPHIHSCVTGTTANFQRAELLRRIAEEMIPSLREDRAELESQGFTRGAQSQKLTAIVEASITSLYSSVDAARKVVTHVFKNYQGLPESTRKTFQGAADGKLDPKLPAGIREAFTQAPWYHTFRRLRDALTHVGPGSCHLDETSGKVMYFHDAIREGDNVTHIPDIFSVLEGYFGDVNVFLGKIFTTLSATLNDDEVWQMCGVFDGRLYSRFFRPSEAINIHSGRCDAHTWFDLPENPRCPLADCCEAYQRRQRSPMPPVPSAPPTQA